MHQSVKPLVQYDFTVGNLFLSCWCEPSQARIGNTAWELDDKPTVRAIPRPPNRAIYCLDFFDINTNTDTLIMIPILNDTDTDNFTTKC